MKNTEKLLSITNLKKYFPVAKTKWFQKEQLYVRANEDITIDIFSGETFCLMANPSRNSSIALVSPADSSASSLTRFFFLLPLPVSISNTLWLTSAAST